MEWPFVELGPIVVVAPDARGVLVEYGSTLGRHALPRNLLRIVPAGESFLVEDTGEQRTSRQPTREPLGARFVRTHLGKKHRLAWPHGATAIDQYAEVATWRDRFAIVLDDRGFSIIDATSDRIARLMLPPDTLRWNFGAIPSAGRMWIGTAAGTVAIPLETLETLAAGPCDVTLRRHHPARQPDKRLDCVFLWYLQDGNAMIEVGDGKGGVNELKVTIALPRLPVAKYAPMQLVDELYPWHYAIADLGPHGRHAIRDDEPITYAAKITVAKAKDPAGVAKAAATALPQTGRSRDEIGPLVETILADPGDDAHRGVLSDLLLELGDPAGEPIAKLRAGAKVSPAKRKIALGPLGPYLDKVDFRGGFPHDATVTRDAPSATDHLTALDAACADFRLAFVHALHSQPGRRADPDVYARLVGAPIATSLRRIDVSERGAIEAVIAAKRDQLDYLEHVDFAEAEWMERLATATFDRVATVHTVVGLAHLTPLVNRLIRDKSGFFARAPRHLVVEETRDRYADLLRELAAVWSRLPLAALSIPGVTITRDGGITGDHAALVAIAKAEFV